MSSNTPNPSPNSDEIPAARLPNSAESSDAGSSASAAGASPGDSVPSASLTPPPLPGSGRPVDAKKKNAALPHPSEPPTSTHPSSAARALRWIYNHNPFYLISVCFVLHGTRFWLHDGARLNAAWQFMAVIGGFILLLDATAFVIVRFGKVWDDARTILLTLLFLFVTLALTFDQTLLVSPKTGQAMLLGGLLFCCLVTEGLLLGLKIRLPAAFRVPLYMQLGLLFVYPLWLQPGATTDSAELSWRIFAFPLFVALAILSLLPAAWRGRALVANNGTPWVWPLFPWCVFVFLGLGLGYRAYALSLSFDPVTSLDLAAAWNLESAFGAWYLVPIVLAVGVVLLEIGRIERLPWTQFVALLLPALAVALSFPAIGKSVPHDEFLALFRGRFGSPVLPTLLAAALIYLYADGRGIRFAREWLLVALLGFSMIGPGTVALAPSAPVRIWPLLVVALYQTAHGAWDRSSPRLLFGLLCGVAAVRFGPLAAASPMLRNGATFLLAVVASVYVARRHDDWLAHLLRPVTALILFVASIPILETPESLGVWAPPGVVVLIIALGAIGAVWFSYRLPSDAWYFLGLITTLMATVRGGALGHEFARRYRGPLDVDSLLLGAACFGLALAISMAKAGLLQKLLARWPRPPGMVTMADHGPTAVST